ncbi:MAG: protein kinase domain-containing protein [Stackebrandtia sp.]
MRAGSQLGNRYRLDTCIDGGTGEVWLGSDTLLTRTVAVKVMHVNPADDPTFRQRFHNEARALSSLQSPSAASLYDYGEEPAEGSGVTCYLVTEFVPGPSLRDIMTQLGALSVDETLDVVAQAAQALHDAHLEGIVHKDIKPGNILIDQTSGSVKVAGFGVAKSGFADDPQVEGAAAYTAPELRHGDDPTPASDIYALGAVAYECLTGDKPVDTRLHTLPPLPAHVSEPVARLVTSSLETELAWRTQNAADLAAACRDLGITRPVGDAATLADPSTIRASAPAPVALPFAGDGVNGWFEEAQRAADATQEFAAASAPAGDDVRPASPESDRDGVTSHRRRVGNTRVLVAAAAVAALVVVGGLAAAAPWSGGDDATTTTPVGIDAPAPNGYSSSDGDSSAPESSSPKGASPGTAEAAPSSESNDEPSDSPTTPSDDPTSSNPKATMPSLYGMTENRAYDELEDVGFTDISSYKVGEGQHACGVVEQNPASGTKHPLSSPVEFGVEYSYDEDCEFQSSDSPPPRQAASR